MTIFAATLVMFIALMFAAISAATFATENDVRDAPVSAIAAIASTALAATINSTVTIIGLIVIVAIFGYYFIKFFRLAKQLTDDRKNFANKAVNEIQKQLDAQGIDATVSTHRVKKDTPQDSTDTPDDHKQSMYPLSARQALKKTRTVTSQRNYDADMSKFNIR